MWPFTSKNIVDQQVANASGFGAMAQPQQLTKGEVAGVPQMQPQRSRMDSPALYDALTRMGSAILIANEAGKGFGGSMGYGMQAFSEGMSAAGERRLREAQIAEMEAKAADAGKYGVQSGGFEGDIARAMTVLRDPAASPQDRAVAQSVIDTAQRLQGSWDPVSGSYQFNNRARLPVGGPVSAPTAPTAAPSAASMGDMPPEPTYTAPVGGLQPFPVAMGANEVSVPATGGQNVSDSELAAYGYIPTGNRRVDAENKAKAIQARIAAKAKEIDAQTSSQSDLPAALDKGQYMLDVIDAAKNSRGLSESVGGMFGLQGRQAELFPLTEGQRQFAPIAEQLRGASFLEAYNSLKGGGAISEAEGKKAEQAIARLQQYQSEGDFVAALNELRGVVAKGMERAKGKATMAPRDQAQQAISNQGSNPYAGKTDAELLKELGL